MKRETKFSPPWFPFRENRTYGRLLFADYLFECSSQVPKKNRRRNTIERARFEIDFLEREVIGGKNFVRRSSLIFSRRIPPAVISSRFAVLVVHVCIESGNFRRELHSHRTRSFLRLRWKDVSRPVASLSPKFSYARDHDRSPSVRSRSRWSGIYQALSFTKLYSYIETCK